jgi:hypothetical protein
VARRTFATGADARRFRGASGASRSSGRKVIFRLVEINRRVEAERRI